MKWEKAPLWPVAFPAIVGFLAFAFVHTAWPAFAADFGIDMDSLIGRLSPILGGVMLLCASGIPLLNQIPEKVGDGREIRLGASLALLVSFVPFFVLGPALYIFGFWWVLIILGWVFTSTYTWKYNFPAFRIGFWIGHGAAAGFYLGMIFFPIVGWSYGPYFTMMSMIALLSPFLCWVFTQHQQEKRLKMSALWDEVRHRRYWWHFGLYMAMFSFKKLTDFHNEPIKHVVGGWTHQIWGIEGAWTLWVQDFFLSDILTRVLNFHYLFVYLFIIWFSPIYYIYSRDHAMADKAALNYFVMYLLAVPLYLFYNVEVTSAWIPGMEALMYHDDWTFQFFTNNDPMDNAVPSLHVAIPFGLILLQWWHAKERGIAMKDWRHRHYHWFLFVNACIYLFSIQYLGIHWVFDVLPGFALAVVGALFVHRLQPRLRRVRREGWRVLFPVGWKRTTGAGVVSALVGCLVLASISGGWAAAATADQPTMRLGPGDVNTDIIEVHSLESPVSVHIENIGETDIWVLVIPRDDAIEHADVGHIDFQGVAHNHTTIAIEAGGEWSGEVLPANLFDVHAILVTMQDDAGMGEVRVTMVYSQQALPIAILISAGAFAMAGMVGMDFALHRGAVLQNELESEEE